MRQRILYGFMMVLLPGCQDDSASTHQRSRSSDSPGNVDAGVAGNGEASGDPLDGPSASQDPGATSAPDEPEPPPPSETPSSDDDFNGGGFNPGAEDTGSEERPPPPEERPPPPATVSDCFLDIAGELAGPDYDRFSPTVGSHCAGTNHQDIDDVEALVFLGDSVTVGTPPTPIEEFYSVRLMTMIQERFGDDVEVRNCAKWGARTDDLLEGKKEIEECFPEGGSPQKTLVVMTIGGNDIANWAQHQRPAEEALAMAQEAAALLGDAVRWLKDPERFPNGSFVVFANPYEYTDATGDVESCPAASLAGMEGNYIAGAAAVIDLHERFMAIAVETGSDMVFTLEHFCGHGYHHDDPDSQCYRGPDAELWFDLTCIHPNPTGHAAIADLFMATIDE